MQNETANKRYYWMRFQQDFFGSLRIKKLRRLAGGDTFTIIYLKLQLLSISNEGYLEYKHVFDSFEEEMSEEIKEDVENIQVTINYLLSCGLMTQEGDTYFLPYAAENIGSETASTQRSRECRIRQKEAKLLQCNTNATQMQRTCSVEKEIEIEKEIDKDNMSTDIDSIVAYLNLKAGTHYQSSTPKTRTLIKARFKEHFTVDDFKTVIDKMTAAWINDSKMRQYLRPETLFGTKFEGYLNRDDKPVTKKGSFNDMMHTEYDMEALEKMLNE